MYTLPIYVLMFVFGAIIGSFLNVVIYRLHTGRSVNGHSHCLSCGTQLRWYELFPIVSYLVLRGRCRTCGARIPARYWLVELLTALSFTALLLVTSNPILLGLYAILLAVIIVIAVYDIYHLIIPNELPAVLVVLAVAIVLYQMLPTLEWVELGWAFAKGMAVFSFYGGLWLVSRGRWLGLGDAKLAFPLAMLLTWSQVFTMVVLSFWVGAAVSLTLMAWPRMKHLAYATAGIAKSRISLTTPNEKQSESSHSLCSSAGVAKCGKYFTTPNEKQSESSHSLCSSAGVAKSRRSFTMKSEIPFAPFLIVAFLATYFLDLSVLALTDYVLTIIFI